MLDYAKVPNDYSSEFQLIISKTSNSFCADLSVLKKITGEIIYFETFEALSIDELQEKLLSLSFRDRNLAEVVINEAIEKTREWMATNA